MEKDLRVKTVWLVLEWGNTKGCGGWWRSEIKGCELGREAVVVVVAVVPVAVERRKQEARREAKREESFEAIEILWNLLARGWRY